MELRVGLEPTLAGYKPARHPVNRSGGSDRNRTDDFFLTKEAVCLLTYGTIKMGPATGLEPAHTNLRGWRAAARTPLAHIWRP